MTNARYRRLLPEIGEQEESPPTSGPSVAPASPATLLQPEWGKALSELRLDGKVVKRVRGQKVAKSAVKVLDAFKVQEEGWPWHVDDPLPPSLLSKRLHDTLNLFQYPKRVFKQLGLEGHIHTCRHSFISNALMKGIPEACEDAAHGTRATDGPGPA